MPIRNDGPTPTTGAKEYEPNADVVRLVLAACIGTDEINLVLGRGVDVNAQDTDGFTALFTIVEMGEPEVIVHLIRRGAAVNHVTRRPGTTPLHYAAKRSIEVVKILLDQGANPNIQERHGRTPLHFAAYFGKPEVLKFLTNRGGDPKIADIAGKTAADWALMPYEEESKRGLIWGGI